MKSCGKRFHDEVGKFRFLNELIKVVSPKVGLRALCWRGWGLVAGGLWEEVVAEQKGQTPAGMWGETGQ